MMKYFLGSKCHLLSLCLVLIISCKEQKQPTQPKNNKSPIESPFPVSSYTLTDFTFITTPSTPTSITRKIRHDNDGNLLIAAYEGAIRYDGEFFTNITNEEGLDTCYAFDAFEDKKGIFGLVVNPGTLKTGYFPAMMQIF